MHSAQMFATRPDLVVTKAALPDHVLSSLAAEVYLKCLIRIAGGTGHGHPLLPLYEKVRTLNPSATTRIEERYDYHARAKGRMNHPSDVQSLLAEFPSPFVDSRYLYEPMEPGEELRVPSHVMHSFAWAIEDVILEIRPDLRELTRPDGNPRPGPQSP